MFWGCDNVSFGVEFFLDLWYLVNVGNSPLGVTAAHYRRSESNLEEVSVRYILGSWLAQFRNNSLVWRKQEVTGEPMQTSVQRTGSEPLG